ncbi:hypothetical protein SAMN05428966_102146 [Massilia sp. PDC64]|nr:hypothetical protein [Massilia sp. PDC64]SDC70161.1 hypothetical protein SAMN05428966_102146 [Massilia sp. PDC64]
MDRFPFDTDDRDGLIADLTERLMRDWSRRLLAGDARSISDLHNVMLDRLSADDAKALFVQAATNPAGADVQFAVLAAKTMRDVCEADATRCVENVEKGRAESRDENRIARAEADRAAV